MARFEYSGLTAGQRLMKGVIEAGSPQEASEQLEQMQLKVTSVEKAEPARPKTAIGRTEFQLFNQQLASITKAGIPLERALRELSKDIASRRMRKLIDEIATDLEAGVSIEQAFEKRAKQFPPLYGRILKAGVETGRLSEMLTSLNRHLDIANRTRKIVFEATAYPAVILVLGAIISTIVLVFIVPQFEEVLKEMVWGNLNAVSTLVFAMSRNVVAFWSAVGLIVAGVVVLLFLLSRFAAGRRLKESLGLGLPVFGRVYHGSIMGKTAEAMAMMVSAGCDMPACLRLSAAASGSEKIMADSEILAGQIEKGTNILEAGRLCRVIPRFFLYSIQLGSQRNELQDSLYSLGEMYAEQVRCSQARLQTLLLPIMLILVGGFLAMTIMGIFLPLVQIVSGLSI